MCISCTTIRVDVAICQTHTVGVLPPSEIATNISAATKLAGGELTGGEVESQWCAVCPQYATHRCTKKQGDGRNGCGLKLCDDCASWLVKDHKGDLTEFIERLIVTTVKHTGEEESAGIRPDAVFFLPRGEMLDRLAREMP